MFDKLKELHTDFWNFIFAVAYDTDNYILNKLAFWKLRSRYTKKYKQILEKERPRLAFKNSQFDFELSCSFYFEVLKPLQKLTAFSESNENHPLKIEINQHFKKQFGTKGNLNAWITNFKTVFYSLERDKTLKDLRLDRQNPFI